MEGKYRRRHGGLGAWFVMGRWCELVKAGSTCFITLIYLTNGVNDKLAWETGGEGKRGLYG